MINSLLYFVLIFFSLWFGHVDRREQYIDQIHPAGKCGEVKESWEAQGKSSYQHHGLDREEMAEAGQAPIGRYKLRDMVSESSTVLLGPDYGLWNWRRRFATVKLCIKDDQLCFKSNFNCDAVIHAHYNFRN